MACIVRGSWWEGLNLVALHRHGPSVRLVTFFLPDPAEIVEKKRDKNGTWLYYVHYPECEQRLSIWGNLIACGGWCVAMRAQNYECACAQSPGTIFTMPIPNPFCLQSTSGWTSGCPGRGCRRW